MSMPSPTFIREQVSTQTRSPMLSGAIRVTLIGVSSIVRQSPDDGALEILDDVWIGGSDDDAVHAHLQGLGEKPGLIWVAGTGQHLGVGTLELCDEVLQGDDLPVVRVYDDELDLVLQGGCLGQVLGAVDLHHLADLLIVDE